MTADLARRIMDARDRLTQAKVMVDLHTKAAATAADDLLTLLSDPGFILTVPPPDLPGDAPIIKPGIRRVEVVGPMTVKATVNQE